MPSFSRADFAGHIEERNERERRYIEEGRRKTEEVQKRPVVVGVPAVEGATPYESMLAATGIVTPDQEFGGREPPRFLEEQLAASAREIAEKRRQTQQRNKERLADQMKKDLS